MSAAWRGDVGDDQIDGVVVGGVAVGGRIAAGSSCVGGVRDDVGEGV
jgi:hypothetical protein